MLMEHVSRRAQCCLYKLKEIKELTIGFSKGRDVMGQCLPSPMLFSGLITHSVII